jgi:hypothetical protein
MSDVNGILFQIEQGDPHAAEKLLPLVYEELRKLAGAKLAGERPGQTLQATALVHEKKAQQWNCRGHFFAHEKVTKLSGEGVTVGQFPL